MKHRRLTGLLAWVLALSMTLSLLPAAPALAQEPDGAGAVQGGSQEGEGVHALFEDFRLDACGDSPLAASLFAAGTGPIPEELAPYQDKDGELTNPYGDWSLDEALRYMTYFELEDSVVLPMPVVDGVYNPDATVAIKRELLQGRGVAISFSADAASASDLDKETRVMSENWAQYTWGDFEVNHGVCIVGWDDSYPASNFLEDYPPPGDGACTQHSLA